MLRRTPLCNVIGDSSCWTHNFPSDVASNIDDFLLCPCWSRGTTGEFTTLAQHRPEGMCKPANASARALFLCDAGYHAAKAVCQQCQNDVQCDVFGVARVRGSWRTAGRPVRRRNTVPVSVEVRGRSGVLQRPRLQVGQSEGET